MSKYYKHLSIVERYNIKEMKDIGLSITEISKKLSRSKGTISMEIKRNKVRNKYMPCVAQKKYETRVHKQELLKIEKSPALLNYIKDSMIKKKWAPDVISGTLKAENSELRISTESIYKFIYTSSVASKLQLSQYLPSKKLKRQERGKRRARIGIPQRTSIHERDSIAGQNTEIGHFEADLTFHKGNQSMNIGSIVDKKKHRELP